MIQHKGFITGSPVADGTGGTLRHWMLFLLGVFAFALSITLLYHGMRGVMRLGGFVAYGGPYEIAHPAPDWILLFPLSIFLMMGSIFSSLFIKTKIQGPNLMALSWSAIFLALGWNFVEFGFGIGMGGHLAIGWIICAVTFVVMGLFPLISILRTFLEAWREKDRSNVPGVSPELSGSGEVSWELSLILQTVAVAGGVIVGIMLFRLVSS